jgi:hypothetical protein
MDFRLGSMESLPPRFIVLIDRDIGRLVELQVPNLGRRYPLVFNKDNDILARRPNMGPPYIITKEGKEWYGLFQ